MVIDQHPAAYSPGTDGLLFTARRGEPIRRNAFRLRILLPVADTLEAPWEDPDVNAVRTRCNRQRGRERGLASRNPTTTRDPGRGRYWDRTSDLCRVKAALSR